MLTTQQQRTSWFLKFVECILVVLAIVNTLGTSLGIIPEKYIKNIPDGFWDWYISGQLIVGIFFGTLYSIYWHTKEKKGRIKYW